MSKSIFLKIALLIVAFFTIYSCKSELPENPNLIVKMNMDTCALQLSGALQMLNSSTLSPRTSEDGKLVLVKPGDWTSGFFPGNLWMMYEYTHDEKWKQAADLYSMNIEAEKWNGKTHDMGFKLYCSFGNGYRLTQNQKYREILIQGAKTLSTRFKPVVGCIRSWDHNADKWEYPVIIDNMINLELLFFATRETGDSTYYKIAVSHATKTMQNHFRSDYSSFHVVGYNPRTGKPVKWNTHQGYSDSSAWARGQAWGLYGYTMMFRETGDSIFLEHAKHIAGFIFNDHNMPVDLIPYWDYDAPNIPNAPRDASAAAVICSALYELGSYCKPAEKESFFQKADKILETLSSAEYLAKIGTNNNFILEHSVGNYPNKSEIDAPIVYADYYFLEANLRRLKYKGE